MVREIIENLLDCILNYAIKCDLNNIDFDADKSSNIKKFVNQSLSYLRLVQDSLDQW